jgi:hypothetical protein
LTGVVAVDWSGAARGAADRIWLAQVADGALRALANGRDRAELIDHLVELKAAAPDGLCVGLDFSFSLPAWFLRQRGHASARDLWHEVAAHGEAWLAEGQPPFWGKPGSRRPELEEHLRRTEREAVVGAIAAKSTFQIGGAGTVGTGSLRGMPHLLTLQQAGFSIWPFDPPSLWTVIEMYPRRLSGPVHKRNAAARTTYLHDHPWPMTEGHGALAASSEDAFDAAISAIVMDQHADALGALTPSTDPLTRLEGRIWDPHNIGL